MGGVLLPRSSQEIRLAFSSLGSACASRGLMRGSNWSQESDTCYTGIMPRMIINITTITTTSTATSTGIFTAIFPSVMRLAFTQLIVANRLLLLQRHATWLFLEPPQKL